MTDPQLPPREPTFEQNVDPLAPGATTQALFQYHGEVARLTNENERLRLLHADAELDVLTLQQKTAAQREHLANLNDAYTRLRVAAMPHTPRARKWWQRALYEEQARSWALATDLQHLRELLKWIVAEWSVAIEDFIDDDPSGYAYREPWAQIVEAAQ